MKNFFSSLDHSKIILGIGASLLVKRSNLLSPRRREGIVQEHPRKLKDDPGSAVAATAIAGVAGTVAFLAMKGRTPLGVKSLRDFLSRQGTSSVGSAVENALASISRKFPLLDKVISKETAAIGTGLITLPIAHSLMVKVSAAAKRRTTDHADTAFMAAWQDNKAGHTGMIKSNNTKVAYTGTPASVNFSGSLSSYYDSSKAFEAI